MVQEKILEIGFMLMITVMQLSKLLKKELMKVIIFQQIMKLIT